MRTDAAKTVMVTALRNSSSKVRQLCCSFAVKVGSGQPIVLEWLIKEIQNTSNEGADAGVNEGADPGRGEISAETFEAAGRLLAQDRTSGVGPHTPLGGGSVWAGSSSQVRAFAMFVSSQVTAYMKEGGNRGFNDTSSSNTSSSNTSSSSRVIMAGYLYILTVLVQFHFQAFMTTDLGPHLVERVLNKFLFTLPRLVYSLSLFL